MENDSKLLIEGKFKYTTEGFLIGICILLFLASLIYFILGKTLGGIFNLVYGLIFTIVCAYGKNVINNSMLKIYENKICYISGGKKGSFEMPINELHKVVLKQHISKNVIIINDSFKNRIDFCTNATEVNDVLQALLKGEKVESKIEKQQQIIVNNNTPDHAEEIRKYKQLLDDGVITEEDFNEKKKQLLQ